MNFTKFLSVVQKHFGEKVFRTVIPRNVKLSECPSFGKPIVLYDIESKGSEAYLQLAKELLIKDRSVISNRTRLERSLTTEHRA